MVSRKRKAAIVGSVLAAAAATTVEASLTLDVRVKGTGAKTATVDAATLNAANNFLEFDVFARVLGTDPTKPEGFQSVHGSFLTSNLDGTGAPNVNAGSVRGDLSTVLQAPFNGLSSLTGTAVDLDGDGDLDVGSNTPTNVNSGFFVARSSSMASPGSFTPANRVGTIDPADGAYVFKIGTVRLNVSSATAGAGTTQFNFRIRKNGTIAVDESVLWSEDSADATFDPSNSGVTYTVKDGANTADYGVGAPVVISFGDPAQWNQAAGGAWGTGSNWIGGTPDGGATARLLRKATSNAAITLDGTRTLSHLLIDNPTASYTVNAGAGTGNRIVLNNDAGTGTVRVLTGSHTLNVPLEVARAGEVELSAGAALAIQSINVGANVPFAKKGAGTLTSSGNLTVGSGSSVSVQAGSMTVANLEGAGGAAAGATTVAGGASLTANRIRQASLTLQGTATSKSGVALKPSNPIPQGDNAMVNVVNSLSIANDGAPLAAGRDGNAATAGREYFGTLDLGNNDLIVRAGSDSAALNLFAELRDMARAGLNEATGFWDGFGLVSSTAANDPNQQLGVAVVLNRDPDDPSSPLRTSFDGMSGLGVNDILVKVTYFGDVDLDGRVTSLDVSYITGGLTGDYAADWISGDMNYDGRVNSLDVSYIGTNFNNSFGSVPEPGLLSLAAVGAMGLMRRRQRR